MLEREIEAREVELETDDVGLEHPERCLEELLTGLITLEHDNGSIAHGGRESSRRELLRISARNVSAELRMMKLRNHPVHLQEIATAISTSGG